MAGVNGSDVLKFLMQFINDPYVWGGQAPGGFDCSGLMWYGYQHFGVRLPRGSNDQLAALRSIPMGQAQVGDLVFFDSDNNGRSDHVGMYAGNGQVLVADNPSVPVHIVSVTSEARITGVGRPAGVLNTNTFDGGLNNASSASFQNIYGTDYSALVPSARPTFDLFGQLGLQSPNSASLNENYGLAASFMESDPELSNLYSQAVAGTWSTDQFQAALQQTAWWQSNSDSARKLLVEKQTNPAQYQQDLANKIPELTDQATKLGVHLSASGMNTLASMALMLNMNTASIDAYMSKYLELNQQGHFLGYAGQVELGIREYARDMGVPLTDDYVDRAVTGVIAGTDSLGNHRANIQNLAEQAFPAYASLIKDGVTVGQIAAPYLAAQSKIWETDPNKLDLFDPTLRGALTKTISTSPDNPGEPAQVPLHDFEKQLRSDPKWLKTNNARESVSATAKQVLGNMGLIAQDVGSAPQTSTSITDNSRASFGSLQGKTDFPTLQGHQWQNPGPLPGSATDLAPNTSFQAVA
jgi:hypothetical protein